MVIWLTQYQGYSTDEVMMFFQQGDRCWLQNQLEPMNHFHVSMHSVFNSRKSECFSVLVRYMFVSMMKNA
ncbi:hypothetical protein HanPSC8_Chr15g0656901 [Helianthus annuus]|nr:hypothetical protein HanPSC8_Chr15g0656901 [Helianthus annuus]